ARDGWLGGAATLTSQCIEPGLPIIVCSVFDDPELARSLEASLVLPKPIGRNDILTALRQLDVV
ncbi:MAG: hypothetical protein MI924_00890, partial [Chloroflexales bacterium]|nr:hypothetical protein [Chloroflexales bacterium]